MPPFQSSTAASGIEHAEPWLFKFGERKVWLGTSGRAIALRHDPTAARGATGCGRARRAFVVDVIDDAGRVGGVKFIDAQGRQQEARARWVLDASGQAALVASRHGTREREDELRNVAIYGYWTGERAVEMSEVCAEATRKDRNNIMVEATPSGCWCWWIPLSESRFSVGVVLQEHQMKADRHTGADDERALSILSGHD